MGDLFTTKIVQLFSDAVDPACPFCEDPTAPTAGPTWPSP